MRKGKEAKVYKGLQELSEKEFDLRVGNTNNYRIVGSIDKTASKSQYEQCNILLWRDKVYKVKSVYIGATVGYIQVGDNEYIRISDRKQIIKDELLIALLICIMTAYGIYSDKVQEIRYQKMLEDAIEISTNIALEQLLASEDDVIELSNPISNNVYLVYTIKDSNTGKEIYKSKQISPGHTVLARLYNHVELGETTIDVHIDAYEQDTNERCGAYIFKTKIKKE